MIKLPRRRAHILLGIIAFTAVASAIIGLSWPKIPKYSALRTAEITRDIKKLGRADIVLAGDSHSHILAESIDENHGNIINAAINGVASAEYSRAISRIKFADKSGLVMLSIGTNDANRKRSTPISDFKDNAATIIRTLAATSEAVIVTAVPPIALSATDNFDDNLIAGYSNALSEICSGTPNCSYIDPHKGARLARNFGLAGASYLAGDGVHLSSYQAVCDQAGICKTPLRQPTIAQKN